MNIFYEVIFKESPRVLTVGVCQCGFNENDCDFYIEKHGIKTKKKKR